MDTTIGVVGSLPEQGDEGLDALKGEAEQLVLLPDLGHDGLPGPELARFLGYPLGIEQLLVLPQCVLELEQEGQVQGGVVAEHRGKLNLQGLAEGADDLVVQGPGQLQPYRGQPAALLHQVCHKLPVVQILVIEGVGVDVGVAGDPDQRLGFHLVARKDLGNKVEN